MLQSEGNNLSSEVVFEELQTVYAEFVARILVYVYTSVHERS
jgi:hypothetical protein